MADLQTVVGDAPRRFAGGWRVELRISPSAAGARGLRVGGNLGRPTL